MISTCCAERMTGARDLMASTDLVQILAQSQPFRGLYAADLQAVLKAAHRRQVERDAFFFHQGEPATACYVLIRGEAKLTQVTPEGNQVLVRFAAPGEELGIIAALHSAAYTLSAQAVGDCLALVWDGETLTRLMERYPQIGLNALHAVADYYRRLLDRYQELATQRVEQRIARTLLRLARQAGQRKEQGVLIGLPLSRENLADMTGTTLYTVSRILSSWEQRGFVQADRERVLIRQPHALVAIAEDLPSHTPPVSP
jgi:CRP/FNR family transcriptional regulator, nitrogen oxide reductase regulator